jgi:TonB family protein
MSFVFALLALLSAQRVHIGDTPGPASRGLTPPDALYYTDPFYTRAARNNRVEGVVTIEGAFDVNGCMKVLRTVNGLGYGLDENALAAIRSWRFSPAKRDGIPVEAIAQVDILFNLADAPPAEYDDVGRVAAGMSPPVVVRRIEPRYTDDARDARLVGTVILQAIIETDGTAKILKIVKPLPLGLTESAVEAIRQWRFTPAMQGGKAIPVSLNIEVAFNLEHLNSPNPDPCR